MKLKNTVKQHTALRFQTGVLLMGWRKRHFHTASVEVLTWRIKKQLSKLLLYTSFGPTVSLLLIHPRVANYIYEHHYLLQHCLNCQKTQNHSKHLAVLLSAHKARQGSAPQIKGLFFLMHTEAWYGPAFINFSRRGLKGFCEAILDIYCFLNPVLSFPHVI